MYFYFVIVLYIVLKFMIIFRQTIYMKSMKALHRLWKIITPEQISFL